MITVNTNNTIVLPFYSELLPFAPVIGSTYLFKFENKLSKSQIQEITYTCTVSTGYVCKFEGTQPTDTKNKLNIYIDGVNTLDFLNILD